jgi:hypothetical protein
MVEHLHTKYEMLSSNSSIASGHKCMILFPISLHLTNTLFISFYLFFRLSDGLEMFLFCYVNLHFPNH